MPKVKRLVLAGLLLAVVIVFWLFQIPLLPTLRISFGFVPLVLGGWLLGPVWTGVIGIVGDILGMMLFPSGGAFFPGYTFNALLTGLIYGFFLFNRPVDRKLCIRLALSLALMHLVVQLGLNTLWLSMQYKQAFIALLPPRVIANIVLFPIELAFMFLLMRFMEKPVNRYLREMSREDEDGGVVSDDTVQ
jgi:ECF transporter S component (folate family)